MRYAETGVNLEVDLTRGNIVRVQTDPRDTELYLGGLGTNAKVLWDRVPPEVEPFSPDNLLIFSAGLLCGTPATGCNRTIVSTISPQTKLMAFSMMGGFWAPELKYAGYDKVIFRGKSPNLVYLWINNDKVEIRDASHLQGKGAIETEELIRQELNEPKAQVAAIGLAGKETINHNHAMMAEDRARLGHFDDNPARQDVEEMGRLIMEGGNSMQLEEQARREGVADLRESGLKKVAAGLISLEEVDRVTKD